MRSELHTVACAELFLPEGLMRTPGGAVVPIAASAASTAPVERRRETPRPAPSSALERLRSAPAGWQREHALERLLAGSPARGLSGYLPPFPEILAEPDTDLMCWRLAQEIQTRADGWLPRDSATIDRISPPATPTVRA
jgi:hypothetical protein